MKKALSKMLAMMLTAALLLSGCGGGTTAEKPAENGETTTAQVCPIFILFYDKQKNGNIFAGSIDELPINW